MPWVKRNLGLVIGGVVALALMGLAGYYLWTKMQEEALVTMELESATARFNELLRRPVHPGNEQVDNIERAKEEHERLQGLLVEVREQIGTNAIPKKVSDQEFRALLDNTVTELQRDAEKLGIALPSDDYWFTFSPQKTAVEFEEVEMLMQQLMDVKALSDVLYSAKIHDLVALKRVPATSEDNNATDFLGDKEPSTNQFTITTPYELTFQGFSTELAKVLEGLIAAKQCFVVRSVGVEKAPTENRFEQGMANPYMMNPAMQRYRRYAPRAPVYRPAPVRRPNNVLLDETKLQFVLMVDSVRLRPSGDQAMAQTSVDPYMEQMQ